LATAYAAGRCSGWSATRNSAAPHLHFHVGNADSGLAAEGVPYAIDGFEVLNPNGHWESRRNELPLQRAIVRFPERE
jgi:hypothetical protein